MRRVEREVEQIISAGIDIGTSTTKLVISRFSLMNTAGASQVPRIEIIDTEIIHKSPIYRTPLSADYLIDIPAVFALVRTEYAKAGIRAEDIQTGAVIITGETATKENAEEMVRRLSDEAGEFLVATAGPDLEGMIAAKGSGAYEYSKVTGRTVANIDIGGGTANIAVYQAGIFKGTCTLHIGGRLIEYEDGQVKKISSPVQKLIAQKGIQLALGDAADSLAIREVTVAMADTLGRILDGKVELEDEPLLLGHPPDWNVPVEDIMFSGGVGECIYHLEKREEETGMPVYNDLGVQLSEELRRHPALARWRWIQPKETVRATVLGAGTQTTEISGATIQVEKESLPIKNLPVYRLSFENESNGTREKIFRAVEQAIALYDPNREGRNFALYLSDVPMLRFYEVQEVAAAILEAFCKQPDQGQPLVIVVENDMAKVLGQSLMAMKAERSVLCIDQIHVENGDYLDIGRVLQSEVVPVVVKTLAFHS
ncbi:ethanolamine ammonia-lyase reactivating factor EutA [Aneurinibacillus thermoaerophilus]|uniref:ethanolamine ammonia-lyase reactivating factor EutA n=1 Tax=Aneurinibacillus thermoaerophilus TaxID=143495 RepID=UPI002E21B545|nr:ethanolamine ammonia-lyase reactivating factor EutA [Aneurinibacillus thermoaerophilus]MED0736112.1 ethanolamine ammonia-lyase reactivating factor EutA [Aneurinibacillus thermoaerophilus]MED0765609.1 ethanolamine ammonia-lyase reactivating factor EutA [Aneurinibacillus thermoaerophilus]